MSSTGNNITVTIIDTIIQDIYESIVYDWLTLASTILLFYAALLKSSQEVEYIWSKSFSLPTWLYAFARYGSLAEQGLLLSIIFVQSESTCNIIANASNALSCLSYTGIQGLLIARAYTLCRSKITTVALAFCFCSSMILQLYDIIAFPGCFTKMKTMKTPDIDVQIALSSDISTVLTDIIIFGICMWKLWGTWKLKYEAGIQDRHSLVSVMIRQSTLRCCFVAVLTVADVVLLGIENTSVFALNFSRAFNTLQNALSSILVADFTLDLRSLNTTKIEASRASLPPLRFSNFLQHAHQTLIVELATPENIDVEGDDYDHDSFGSIMEDIQPAEE